MGEPLLAAYLQTLLDKLDPFLNSDRQERFISKLRTWRSKLLHFRHVLSDAEEKQMRDLEVKKWLDKLRDLAYNADDVLEELRHASATLQRQNNSSSDPVVSSSQLQDLLAQIQGITKSFSNIERDKKDLRLKERPGVRTSIINNRLRTTSLVDLSQVVGRKEDITAILKLLDIRETPKAEENRNPVGGMGGLESSIINKPGKLERSLGLKAPCSETLVIPIVGMGGVGKTTLAKCIYNHNALKKNFNFKVWLCVSDNFDIIGVTKEILCRVATKDDADVDDLNLLQERLKEKISRQRFLIVLDDIWNEDYGEWENLFIPLKFGRPGSVVIVTTRSPEVAKITGSTASITGSTFSHSLNLLNDDECLSIFARHALGAENFDAHQNLKVIAEKMVSRCGGLPLAAKTLGGLLRGQDQAKWEEVSGSSLWSGSVSEEIAPVLGLSFNYLPSHLKWCFVYCSIFPKDYEFDKEELILLWMAEGFLGGPNEEKQMEDLGHKYFHDLLSRSFLQQSSHHSTKFVMHDLIHDLAQTIAGRVCYRMEDKEEEDVDIEALRHLSYPHQRIEPNKMFEVLKNTKRLRTLLALPTQGLYLWSQNMLPPNFIDLLRQLRYLRVLSLSFYPIFELPISIGDLKYLRYLNLSYTFIRLLPESLYGLHYLQSLILKSCLHLQQLPLRLKDLANLRYLDISGTNHLPGLPPHVLDLKFFQKLTKFAVGEGGRGFVGLQKGYRLPGDLRISILDKVEDVEDALVINLMNKKNIEELEFQWGLNFVDIENADCQVQILNLLEPRKMLRSLRIEGYSGVTLPKWIGDSSYSKLVVLSLIYCKRCKSLPSLGQLPLLEILIIREMLEIETIGTELYGEASQPFPSLKTLEFERMPKWVNWSLPVGITSLLCLRIKNCPQLELPVLATFPSLRDLCFFDVNRIEGGLPRGLQYLTFGGCENVEKQMWDEWASPKLPSLTRLSIYGGFRDGVHFPFPAQESQSLLPPTLTSLFFKSFPNLESLSSSAFRNLTSLAELHFLYCPKLQSLPIEALPPSLGTLSIVRCPELEPKCKEGGEYWPRLSLIPKVQIS